MIIIDQRNQTARLNEIQVTVIYRHADVRVPSIKPGLRPRLNTKNWESGEWGWGDKYRSLHDEVL